MSLFVSRMCFIFLECSEAGRQPPLSSPWSHYPLCEVMPSFIECVHTKEFSHGGLRIQQIDTIKGKHFFCFLNDPHLSAGAPPVHPRRTPPGLNHNDCKLFIKWSTLDPVNTPGTGHGTRQTFRNEHSFSW